MDNKNIIPNSVNKKADDQPQKRYTKQQIKDAEAFLDNLKKIPDEHYEAGRLLVLGFMTALDKKPE